MGKPGDGKRSGAREHEQRVQAGVRCPEPCGKIRFARKRDAKRVITRMKGRRGGPRPRRHQPRRHRSAVARVSDHRPIPPGSCSWCGHEPHDGQACARSIRTRVPMPHGRDVENVPCPCARRNR
jgi:hypothetical protein